MKKFLTIMLLLSSVCAVTVAQNTLRLVESAGGCGLSTDCNNDLICYDIMITPDREGEILSYNIWVDYDTVALRYASDSACRTDNGNDNNLELVDMGYRVSGVQGAQPVSIGVEYALHTICFTIQDRDLFSMSDMAVGGTRFVSLLSAITFNNPMSNEPMMPEYPFSPNPGNTSCLVPMVNVSKEVISPASPTGNPNEYSVAYRVAVSNNGQIASTYDLTDSLRFGTPASNIQTVTAMYEAGDGFDGIDNTGSFDGQADYLISDNEKIGVGRGDSFIITVTYLLDEGAFISSPGEIDCDVNNDNGDGFTGLRNIAAIGDSIPPMTAEVCTPIIPPRDTIVVPPGDTCLDMMTFELPKVTRVEVCGTDSDINFQTGSDSCVTVTPTNQNHSGVDEVCIILCDMISGVEVCDTTVIIVVTPPPPDTIVTVLPPTTTDTICYDNLLQFGGGYDGTSFCGNTGITAGFTETDTCLSVTTGPTPGEVNEVCILTCYDTAGIEVCDTTIVIVIVSPPRDTIVVPPGDTCLDAMTYELPEVDRVEVCGTDADINFQTGTDSCVTVTPNNPNYSGVDEVCIILCDTIAGVEICDTTIIIIVTPPPPDTIITVLPPTTTDTICYDNLLQFGGGYDGTSFCGNTGITAGFTETDTCLSVTTGSNPGEVNEVCILTCYDTAGIEVCDTTIVIVIVSPPRDTIVVPPGDTCLDAMTYELPEVDRVEVCGTDADINFQTGTDSCVTVTPNNPNYSGVDEVCIILCDTIAGVEICDTTIIIVVTPPPPDTIVTVLPPTTTDTICYDQLLQFGGGYDGTSFCGNTGITAGFTETDTCLSVTTGSTPGEVDEICILTCYDTAGIEVCDTTIVIVIVSPPRDTIVVPPGDTCLDAMTYELPEVERVEECGTDADINFITGTDSCVTVTPNNPNYSGVDEVCIILCDTIAGVEICDTTIIIVVTPPPPDTIVTVLPPTTTDTICYDQLLQFGGGYDGTSFCGNTGITAGFTETDTCLSVTTGSTPGEVDEICILTCYDTAGIEVCDTTIVIVIVSPPRDTIVVPPGDTCLDAMTYELPEVDRVEVCGTDADINFQTGTDSCVTVTPNNPNYSGVDEVCIILCDTIAGVEICDTTIIIVVTPPPPDTIITVLPPDTRDTICYDNLLQFGQGYDGTSFCGSTNFVRSFTEDTCLDVTSSSIPGTVDQVCIETCYDTAGIEVCDTTVIIIVVSPPRDTIIVPPGDTCLDAATYELAKVERVEVCGTDPDITFTTGSDSCVTVTPVDPNYGGIDTVCLVLCDQVNGIELCDTTVIIVVTPPPPDTIRVVIPPTTTDTICYDNLLQFGQGYDGTSFCGFTGLNPGFTTPDTCLIVTTGDQSTIGNMDTVCIETCYDTVGGRVCDTTVVIVTTAPEGVRLTAFLSGALGDCEAPEDFMFDSLRSKGLIPTEEPYSMLSGFTHVGGGGGETIANPAVLNNLGTQSVVDWIFVELRDKNNQALVVATRSGLLLRDGSIVDTNGTTGLTFDPANVDVTDSFYVAIRHRNHLGAMSEMPIAFTDLLAGGFDFSDFNNEFYNNPGFDGAEQRVVGARYALWAGDANGDSQVDRNDDPAAVQDAVFNDAGNTQGLPNFTPMRYSREDVNLDGSIIYTGQNNDIDAIMNAIYNHPNNAGNDPAYIVPEQLPTP